MKIFCVVEGHGEVEAVPILVRRMAFEIDQSMQVDIPHPVRSPKGRLLKQGELERVVELAARNVAPTGGILILLDSDDDCPGRLGPQLLDRNRTARGDLPIAVVLAKREFEAWFLAAAESLRGYRGLPSAIARPADPENVQGAKEWLSRQMPHGYAETIDQPAFAAQLSIAQARGADSFDKCYREVHRLLTAVRAVEGDG